MADREIRMTELKQHIFALRQQLEEAGIKPVVSTLSEVKSDG
jgi:hypothetical protein